MDVQLVFSPVWSWPLIIAVAPAMFGLVLWTYPARVAALPPWKRRTMLSLRLLAAAILLFAMLRPALEFREIDERGAQIVFLTDNSRSMNTPDAPGGQTRRQHLLKTIELIDPSLKALAEKVDLRFIDFSETSKAVEKLEPGSDGRFTAIGLALEELRKEDKGKRVAAIFLGTDGAQRASGEADVDPRAAARRVATQKSIPIHPVPFGTSEISTTGMDLAVEDLLTNPTTYERKIEVVKAKIRMVGAPGRKIRVKLMMEDRTGKKPGEAGVWREVPFTAETKPSIEIETNENAAVLPVTLSFVASLPGEYKLALEAEIQPGEVKTANNRAETLISVSKGGLSVAYFDSFRSEQKFIRKLNDESGGRIQLNMWFTNRNVEGQSRPVDRTLFDPGRFEVYIIGNLPHSAFRVNGVNLLDEKLADRVTEGAGLLLLGGDTSFNAGGYAGTKIGELFPVKLAATANPGLPNSAQMIRQPMQMLPTPSGDSHFLMQLGANGEQAWRALPMLSQATRLTPKPASEVLGASADNVPLLIATDVGRSRVAALATNETWKWHLHGFKDAHQRFYQQLLLWLAHKENDSDQALWVRIDPRNFAPGGKVPIQMGLRDDKKQPVENADFTVEVTGPDGKSIPVPTQKQKGEALAEFTSTLAPGDYWATVRASVNGKSTGLPTLTRFIVEARDPELDNPAADPDLLAEIANLTGGSVVPPEKLGTFLDDLLKSGISTELTRNRIQNLWDNWWLLLLFASVMSAEWYLRKKNGLV